MQREACGYNSNKKDKKGKQNETKTEAQKMKEPRTETTYRYLNMKQTLADAISNITFLGWVTVSWQRRSWHLLSNGSEVKYRKHKCHQIFTISYL